MPGSNQRTDGSAEAGRWVEDALENVRAWFPDVPHEQLRGPLEQAFDLASSSARGEREFHAVFEAELRRLLEERDVFGSADSVLPSPSSGAPKQFHAIADAPAAEEPEPDPEPEPHEHDRASALALTVGALRFRDGLSPEEIQEDQGIDPPYYVEVMQWLLGEVDATLDGEYPGHLDRERLAGFAAGLEDRETSAAIESHTRSCLGCATYLADLLDGLVRMVPPAASGRRSSRKPVMQVKADELRKYAVRAESRPAARPAPAREAARVRRRRGAAVDRDWRRTGGGLALLLAVAFAAVLVAIDIGGTPGSDPAAGDATPRAQLVTPGTQRVTPGAHQLKEGGSPLGRIFPEPAERSAQGRTRRRRSARAERPPRRPQPPSTTRVPSRPAPAPAVPAVPPASSAPAAPPASSAPAAPPSSPPASPPPTQSPPPSGEFGLEP